MNEHPEPENEATICRYNMCLVDDNSIEPLTYIDGKWMANDDNVTDHVIGWEKHPTVLLKAVLKRKEG